MKLKRISDFQMFLPDNDVGNLEQRRMFTFRLSRMAPVALCVSWSSAPSITDRHKTVAFPKNGGSVSCMFQIGADPFSISAVSLVGK